MLRRGFTNRLRRLERRTRGAVSFQEDNEARELMLQIVQGALLAYPPAEPYPFGMSIKFYLALAADRWPHMRRLFEDIAGDADEAARFIERVKQAVRDDEYDPGVGRVDRERVTWGTRVYER